MTDSNIPPQKHKTIFETIFEAKPLKQRTTSETIFKPIVSGT